MSSRTEKIKKSIQGSKNKKQMDFHSIKSKFDLLSILLLPITSISLCLFSKKEIIEDTNKTVLTSLFITFIARTGLMYYANSKRKAAPRVSFFLL